jgi:hypothetical protein
MPEPSTVAAMTPRPAVIPKRTSMAPFYVPATGGGVGAVTCVTDNGPAGGELWSS